MRTEQGTLLDEARLAEAVAIHEACYRLLQWLTSAVDRGFVPEGRAHGAMGESDAAADWIATHFASLPPPCRPSAPRGEPRSLRQLLLQQTCVIELGLAIGRALSDRQIDRVLADEWRSVDAALVAYGVELLRRCDGGGSGPAALALWRQFAWRTLGTGARRPRRAFELTLPLVLDAERRLKEAVESC